MGRDFDYRQNGVLSGTIAGVAELLGSVIESPQGLHSNAYKFWAKARLMIWKVIGLPQTGQATSAVKSSLIGHLCTRCRSAVLTRINTSAKKPPRGLRLWSPWQRSTPVLAFRQSSTGRIQLRTPDTSPASAGTRAHAHREIDISALAGQTSSLLDLTYVKAESFRLLFYVLANRKLASVK
jgi:hypothetical protein